VAQSIEVLELELARIEKRLRRESKQNDEHNLKIARSRVRRAQNYRAFLLSQTPRSAQENLERVERQQIVLAEQIANLQERARYYTSLIDNREELIARADEDIRRCQQHVDKLTGPTVESLNETFAAIQQMMMG
jgi:peptidoglycan hydrolase CwlO-like protein